MQKLAFMMGANAAMRELRSTGRVELTVTAETPMPIVRCSKYNDLNNYRLSWIDSPSMTT